MELSKKARAFEQLYSDIAHCRRCSHVQSEKALRVLAKMNIHSKVMMISEAMAPSQVRLSGVNFYDVNGKMGNTGKMLEKFLMPLGLSVDPAHPNCIYNTEIVHCFPWYTDGATWRSIRRPSSSEVVSCIGMGFIAREIELLSPQIIFLMGATSYETFYKRFIGVEKMIGLTEKINDIKSSGAFDRYGEISIIPLQHASWANPRYHAMLNDMEYVILIRKYLL